MNGSANRYHGRAYARAVPEAIPRAGEGGARAHPKAAPKAPRRILCLRLPRFAAERPLVQARARARRGEAETGAADRPFAVWTAAGNRLRIAAANAAAEAGGVHAGLALADGRALCPALETREADPHGDARALARLAAWCRRFAPWTAPFAATGAEGGAGAGAPPSDGIPEAGVWLDVTGCAHLFGGEDALLDALARAFARAGYSARAGLAETPGGAYGLARAGDAAPRARIAPPGGLREALAPLGLSALRIDAATASALHGLGLRRVGDLYPHMTGARRTALARRFPPLLMARLDQALGLAPEPFGPRLPRPRPAARFALPEPTRSEATVARICRHLVAELAPKLEARGLGARRLVFSAFLADGRVRRVDIATARPVADAAPLMRLFALRLPRLDPAPGADGFLLEAPLTEPLAHGQGRLATGGDAPPEAAHGGDGPPTEAEAALAPLIDRLCGRLGTERVGRIALRPNHLPERAQVFLPCTAPAAPGTREPPVSGAIMPGARAQPRPLRLLPRPERLEAEERAAGAGTDAVVPPPARFFWRGAEHRVVRAEGPERIALDWWTLPGWQADDTDLGPSGPGAPAGLGAAIRDYWRIEDAAGQRFWIYRVPADPHAPGAPGGAHGHAPRPAPSLPGAEPGRWYLHGLFP